MKNGPLHVIIRKEVRFLKKLLLALAVLMLLPICLAEMEYAMQGNIRVYVENDLAGLEDAEGNPLCEAKYTCIEAFLNRDYAVACIGVKQGVVSRDGKEVVPVEWDSIELTDDGKAALLYGERGVHLTALGTGKTVFVQRGQMRIGLQDDRISVFYYGKNGRPPFRTDVYDSDLELIFSVDAEVGIMQCGYYVAEYADGRLALLDMQGELILDGVQGFRIHDNGLVTYHKEIYRHTNAFEACIDIVGNALDRGLWKNSGVYRDRNCLEWVLYRGGIVTQPREIIPTVGIFDGESILFEYSGEMLAVPQSDSTYSGSLKPAGEGMYLMYACCEGTEGWIYVDESGKQMVEGIYEKGYSFVNGTAVVFSNGRYFLIDRNGERVGDVSWSESWIGNDSFDLNIIYVYMDDGDAEETYYRLIDRSGVFVNDVRYSIVWGGRGYYLAVDQEGKCTVLNYEGKNVAEGMWEGYSLASHEYVTGPWVRENGLAYHIDINTGEFTHEQGYSYVDDEYACLPDGESWVVIDANGNPVGPYYGYYAKNSW